MLIKLLFITLGILLNPICASPTPPSFTNQSATPNNALDVPTTPLFILQSAPSFYRPSYWTCPDASFQYGGGLSPWSLYYVNLTALALNPADPIRSSTETIRFETRYTGTVDHSNDQRYPVGSSFSVLVVDGRGNMARTDASPLEIPPFNWWTGEGICT
ncbi:hypothetical protein RQP46_009892 [Phenoliferia psychrophenolica]